VVIGYLDIKRITALPSKADSVLVIDANTVLSCPISLERLKPVSRGRSKITNLVGAIDLDQPAKGNSGDLLKSSDWTPFKNLFGIPIAKGADQTSIVLRFALNVKRA
jgi:hypothetical protein